MPSTYRVLFAVVVAMAVLSAHVSSSGALEGQSVWRDSTHASAIARQGVVASLLHAGASDTQQKHSGDGFQARSSFDASVEARSEANQSATSNKDLSKWTEEDSVTSSSLSSLGSHTSTDTSTEYASSDAVRRDVGAQLTVNATDTHESFATRLCALLTGVETSVEITVETDAQVTTYFDVPACLTNLTSIVLLDATKLRITKADDLPASLTTLKLADCRFDPPTGSSTTIGFDSEGNIAWADWWLHFPSLSSVDILSVNIKGVLPDRLPNRVLSFQLRSNLLPLGNISSTLFEDFTGPYTGLQLTFTVTGCGLTGTIPGNLFAPFSGTTFSTFAFAVSSNNISGSLPSYLLSYFSSAAFDSFNLDLRTNQLSGDVPLISFPSGFLKSGGSTLSLQLANNQLTGLIPDGMLANLNAISTLNLDLSNNLLSSQLPSQLFSNCILVSGASITVNFGTNRLSGPFTTSLITSAFESQNVAILLFAITVSNNRLSGTFPDTLTSSFPGSSTTTTLQVSARNNTFTGGVPTNCNGLSRVILDVSMNQLNGTIPSTQLSSCTTLTLNVSSNFEVSGSIPSELFNLTSLFFFASNTNLDGKVPPLLTSTSGRLDLSSTNIDFCSVPLASTRIIFNNINCHLDRTNACGCLGNYSGCSVTSCDQPLGYTLPPSAPPTSPPTPAPTAQSAPSGCDPKTRPSLEFTCINGVWTAITTSSPVLTIPSGAGVVVVEGNVSSSTIIINGVGSKIIVGGCLSNLSSLVVELSPEQVKQLEFTKSLQELLTLANRTENCNVDLNNVALNTRSSGCRKVATEKVVSSNGNTLGALFTVSSGGCNRWWIILVSVVVAVVILGLIAAVVGGVLWKRHQDKKSSSRISRHGLAA